MVDYLKLIDRETQGRCDVTPLFADHDALSTLAEDLLAPFPLDTFDIVAGIDALGFVLGTSIALKAGKGLLPIRKGEKFPVAVDRVSFIDYSKTEKALEIRQDALQPGMRVLIADEWIETGTQVSAAVELIEKQSGIVAGITTINIDKNPKTQRLQEQYKCFYIWKDC